MGSEMCIRDRIIGSLVFSVVYSNVDYIHVVYFYFDSLVSRFFEDEIFVIAGSEFELTFCVGNSNGFSGAFFPGKNQRNGRAGAAFRYRRMRNQGEARHDS